MEGYLVYRVLWTPPLTTLTWYPIPGTRYCCSVNANYHPVVAYWVAGLRSLHYCKLSTYSLRKNQSPRKMILNKEIQKVPQCSATLKKIPHTHPLGNESQSLTYIRLSKKTLRQREKNCFKKLPSPNTTFFPHLLTRLHVDRDGTV